MDENLSLLGLTWWLLWCLQLVNIRCSQCRTGGSEGRTKENEQAVKAADRVEEAS
jgi:hypothetical protein